MEADGETLLVTDGERRPPKGLLAEVRSLPGGLWRACVAVSVRVVGHAWRRVTTLSVFLLVGGVLLVVVAKGGALQEIGTAFIGGSVVGLVLTIAQHTLDQQALKRQAETDMQLAVNASSELEGIGLRGASLSRAYLRGKALASANLDDARLDGADLRESNLIGASLTRADLRRADLRGADLTAAHLDGANLAGALLDADQLRDASLVGAHLVAAEITPGEVDSASPSDRVDLSRARLDGAELREVRLVELRASFASATGVDATAADLRDGDFSCADLRGAGLSRADLRRCDLSGADLRSAVLAGADLTGARLVGARMSHIDLTGAVVDDADLRRADLRGAFLTNVDLGSAALAGAWVMPNDLRRAEGSPSPGEVGAVVVDVEPEAGGYDHDMAAVDQAPLLWRRRRRRRGERTRLVVVAETADLGPMAREVARHLRDRRRGVDHVNGDIENIIVNDGPPYVGDPDGLGLPDRVKARRWPGWRHPHVVLRRHPAGFEVVLHRRSVKASAVVLPDTETGPGAPSETAADEGPPAAEPRREPPTAHVAAAVQFALAGKGAFLGWEELDALGTWLEQHDRVALVPTLDEVLTLNGRNCVALLLRAWMREVGDAEAAALASDELRIVWGASGPGLGGALAAARLATAQCQLVHRTSVEDPTKLVARAQAAGDASLSLLGDPPDEHRRPRGRRLRRRQIALRSKAELARALAAHIYGGDRPQPDHRELDEGIRRYRRAVGEFEANRLPVSPAFRNNLAYCLMARVGRFMTGPGQGYSEAATQFRLVLDQFDVYEQYCNDDAGFCSTCGRPLRRSLGVYKQHCVGETEGRPGAISVQEMARLSALGKESGPETNLRRRRELRLALANLGNVYRLFKQFDAALNCYGAALYCEPHYIEAYGERAWVRLEQADADGATRDIERALAVPFGTSQQKARIVLYYVDALDRVGRAEDQGPWIERAQQLDPESHRAKELADEWKAKFVDNEDGES